MKNYRFTVKNLDCAECARKIEKKLSSYDEYKNVVLNFATLKLSFDTEKDKNVKQDIQKIIKSVEPDVKIVDGDDEDNSEEDIKKDLIRLIIGILIFGLAIIYPKGSISHTLIVIASYIVLLFETARTAIKQIFKNKVLDESALITISVIGAFLIGKEFEGVMVIALYEIGEILESKAVNKSRKSIAKLMDIKPEFANLKNDDAILSVEPSKVNIGDTIVVKTGEKIPLDGVIVSGEAEIDNSALTGESKIINVKQNDRVLSGSINVQGLLEIKVTSNYENSTVNKILQLVENATDKKAKTETFVSKAAKIYTPIVLGLAAIVAIFMPLIFGNVSYSESIYKALVFLVISCPCSIVISVPLSYFSGIGKASRSGILIKGSDYLDGLKDIGNIVFDKTGTITTGNLEIESINSYKDNITKEEILKYFALGESFSNHPIAKSILKEVKDIPDLDKVKNYTEEKGKGIAFEYEENSVKIGNSEFVEKIDDNIDGSVLYLKLQNEIIGDIILKDKIKPEAKTAISKLKQMNIITRMFTGDRKQVAMDVAKKVGIDEVNYKMLPEDKYNKLEEILNNSNNKKVAFVGDGINDSPVLARADIGISMGGIGSSSAIEASDIVIMTDELTKIVEGIKISKKTNKIIIQNLIFSLAIKVITLILAWMGYADMWQAVFADVGVTLITIFNTIRILK